MITTFAIQIMQDCMPFVPAAPEHHSNIPQSKTLFILTLHAVASIVGLAPEGSSLRAALTCNPQKLCRVLCIGLGGGTLPIFLAHHFPGMVIDVVEIDPVVIAAAQLAMGFPKQR